MKDRILIIEDDLSIARLLYQGLLGQGYRVHLAINGKDGLTQARDHPPDLVILDLMLPDLDGLTICHRLRSAGSTPILILTAKEAVPDKVDALDAGADDYLVKPFDFAELEARLRALLRRSHGKHGYLTFADLTLDHKARQVWRASQRVELTAREFDLLALFLEHPGEALSRRLIYEHTWGHDFGNESNVIEAFISDLRAKLESGGRPRLIHTVRSVGYILREE